MSQSVDDLGMGDFFDESKPQVQEVPAIEEQPVESKVEPTEPEVEKVVEQEIREPEAGGTPDETDDASALRKQLDEALGQLSIFTTQTAAASQPKEPELKIPENPQEVSNLDFLQGKSPADLFESPEEFNALMNRIATTAARAGQQAGYEMAMRTIPSVVQSSAQQQFQLQTAADNFYKKNSDLVPFKKAVSMAALDYYSKNPGATPDQILEGAAVATRDILRLRGTAVGRVPAQPAATPGVGGGTSRNEPTVQLTTMEQQILDTLKAAQ